jgi:hypothetical protein
MDQFMTASAKEDTEVLTFSYLPVGCSMKNVM